MNSSTSAIIKYGLFSAFGLIAYFLIVKVIGLHNNPWLRVFNGAIVGYGIYASIKHFKVVSGADFTYANGFKTGLLTGFLATFVFAVFMAVYMFHIDVEFMNNLLKNWFTNLNQGGGVLIFIIIIEGMSSSMVLTLASMQYFKNSGNLSQNK